MGKIYVVGVGPGAYEDLTIRAACALEEAEMIVGYTVYVDLLRDSFPGKLFLTTGMRKEEDRCRMALEAASEGEGRVVALVCSGDAGIYGLASLMLTYGRKVPQVEIEVIPGVTAALSGGAILGAPLTTDCCLISLSDLMTPLEKIKDRIRAAAQADFPIVLYNPSSRKRAGYLREACDLVLAWRSADTVCGYVRKIAREGQESKVLTLGELRETSVDMFTTVFIGNTQTQKLGGRMITPRGYPAEQGTFL